MSRQWEQVRSSDWAIYGVAILSVGVALAAGHLADIYLKTDPFVSLFLCAILFSAWFGGGRCGLAAAALSIVAFAFYFVEPAGSLLVEATELPRLVLFALVALFVVTLSSNQRRTAETLRRARDELRLVIHELERVNNALQAENAERQRAERVLRLIVDTIPVMAASYQPDGRLDFVNKTWRDYTGLPGENIGRERWGSAIHPDDMPRVESAWRVHLATGEPFQLEQRMRRADGDYRWFLISRVPLRDESGEVIKWYGAGYDIHDQKQALDALRQSEGRLAEAEHELQLLIDTIPVIVGRYRADGSPDFVNKTARDFTGLSLDDLYDRRWAITIHPDDLPQIDRAWRAHLATGEPLQIEYRMRHASGEYRWQSVRRVPLRNEKGEVIRWYGAGYDIEDYKRASAALERSEAELAEAKRELQLIVDTIPTMVRRFNADGTPDFVNKTSSEFTGVPSEAQRTVAGGQAADHPDDREEIQRLWHEHLRTGEPYDFEYRLRRADGVYRWVHSRRVPLRDASGKVVRWYAAAYDIDEQRRALADLQRSEAELAEAKRELQLIVDTIPVMVRRYNADGTPDFVNRTIVEFTGIPPEAQPEVKRFQSAEHPDDHERLKALWPEKSKRGEPFEVDFRLRRADGQYRWIHSRRVPLRDETGKIIRWYGAGYDVEDEKRAMEALKHSEAELARAQRELQQIVDTIPVLVRRFRNDGTSDFVNRTTSEFTGMPAGEQPPSQAWRLPIHPDDRDRIERLWRAHLRTGEPLQSEYRMRRADGVYRWMAIHRVPLRDENGEIIYWYGAALDIEDQKRAMEALQRSEAELAKAQRELQLIVDTIPVMVRRFDADGVPDFINKTAAEYSGIPSDIPLSAKDRPRPDHPEDRAALDARWREHMKTGEPFDSEFRLRRADGVYRWVFSRRVPLRDENGEVIKWYAAAYDIDDQKQAMAALRHSEAELAKAQRELQLIVDTIPAMVTTYRADSTLEFINKTWRDYTGFTPDEYTHERWQLVIHPDDFPVVDRAWTEHLASKTPFQNELRVRRADGSYRWVLTSRVPLLDEDGEVIRWYGASYDIDEQKQALAALRRSEAYLDEAQRLSQTGSFGWNLADGTIVWSKEAYRILDFDERVTPTLDMVLERAHPDDIHIVRDHIDRARRGGQSYDYEHRLLRTDGSVRQIHVRSRLIDYGPGEQEMVGALMDVTAAREAEAALHAAQTQLAHATRMTTLGEMSASIAHEVNQPLAAITTDGQAGLRWLERKTPNVDEATQAMRRVVAEAGRASAVMSRIRSLAKKADLEMAPLDINEVIDEAVMLVRREAQSHHVTLRFELAPALPAVLGDRIQLQQVLINLMINGVQAMATVSDRARDLCVCSGRLDTDQVLVAVRDAGVGVAPENLPRLFAAFYTTKRDGMGMGLSICRSIVEAHGGRVWAAPNDGGGMTFHFTVAAYAPAA